jgi:hypothetical protein
MDKQQKQIIITGILILILIIAWIHSFKVLRKRFAKKASSSASVEVILPQNISATLSEPLTLVDNSEEEDLQWHRCPFCGIIYTETEDQETIGLRLMGILWDDKEPMVIIGEDVFKQGDKIGKFVITEIRHNKVIVNDGVRDFELRVGE